MKKIVRLLVMVLLFLSCSNGDDDGIDCALFDPGFPSLYIRIVNSTGDNLIGNGTIDPNDVKVEGDFLGAGFQFIPPNEFANPDADIREFDNTLKISIPNESKFQYTIHLDDITSIKVDFTAELTRIPCDITYFKPNNVTLDGETFELIELPSLQYLVVIAI